MIARGVTATVGNVFEPYLEFTHQPHVLVHALLQGKTWGDAAYESLRALSWMTVTIGDPLYRPFGKSFAEQWAARDQLPNDLYPYLVLREARELEDRGQTGQALDLLVASQRERPSAPLAIRAAEIAEATGKKEIALREAKWFVSAPAYEPSTMPLAQEAALALTRLNSPGDGVIIFRRLLGVPTLSRDFRVLFLEGALKAATAAHEEKQAATWRSEAEVLWRQKP